VAALYNMGNAQYLLGEIEKSIETYYKALDVNPGSAECHFNLGSAFNDLGQKEKSIEHYKKCVELDQSNLDGLLCLAKVY